MGGCVGRHTGKLYLWGMPQAAFNEALKTNTKMHGLSAY
jgi:hypothetical protein